MNGADDLAAIDALQVDAGDPKVGVGELTLDHDQRDAFVRHLDCVSMPQLVRRDPPSSTVINTSAAMADDELPPIAVTTASATVTAPPSATPVLSGSRPIAKNTATPAAKPVAPLS
jgi:hypothetical protein